MRDLSVEDWCRLLDCVGEFYSVDDPQHFRERVVAVARGALPAECANWLVADPECSGSAESYGSGASFSDSDKWKLNLLRPHLSRAYARTQRATELRRTFAAVTAALAATGKGVIALDERGRVVVWTELAGSLVARYFGRAPAGADELPAPLERWFRGSELSGIRTGTTSAPRKPYVTDRAGMRLTVYWLFGTDTSQRLLLLEESLAGASAFVLEQRLGVTARQAEVLLWITLGKTSPEIAGILGLSVGTINKHVEHILAHLGAPTRTAAALQAMEAMNQPAPRPVPANITFSSA